MTNLTHSLESIATGYCIFEKDQVLTEEQLNSLAQYLDDQDRLGRIALVGVGIACGLHLTHARNRCTLTKGVGVTTDGDLIHVDADRVYTHFQGYGKDAPVYAPLMKSAQVRVRAFELVAGAGTEDTKPLSDFEAVAGNTIDGWLAILFVQSSIRNQEECAPEACDNFGQMAMHELKLLLIHPADARKLLVKLPTPAAAYEAIPDIVANRVVVGPPADTNRKMATTHRGACLSLEAQVKRCLEEIATAGQMVLGTIVANANTNWPTLLRKGRPKATDMLGFWQSYHAFLCDLTETCATLKELLFDDYGICVVTPSAFVKHLVLGRVSSGGEDPDRTPFYPTAANQRQSDRDRARFLVKKLDTMLRAFTTRNNSGIRITPSKFVDVSVEDRAIPWYYGNRQFPMHAAWSHAMKRRGHDRQIHAYHAHPSGARGSAAAPLTTSIGRYPFFRIEGHLGREIDQVVEHLQGQIHDHALPFDLVAVCLGSNSAKVVTKRPRRPSDLRKLHSILKQDLTLQLDELAQFGQKAVRQLELSVAAGSSSSSPLRAAIDQIKGIGTQRSRSLVQAANTAKASVAKGKFGEFRTNTSWADQTTSALRAASQLGSELLDVADVRSTLFSPAERLVSSSHIRWLGWIEQLEQDTDSKQQSRWLFTNFAKKHPGLEHFGGVLRGGTFVLVHEPNGRVVGDFMLSYVCCETEAPDESPPSLEPPSFNVPWPLDRGFVAQPLAGAVAEKLGKKFKEGIRAEFEGRLRQYGSTFDLVQQSVRVLGSLRSKSTSVTSTPFSTGSDEVDSRLRDADQARREVEDLRSKHVTTATRNQNTRTVLRELRIAERRLAEATKATFKAVDTSGIVVEPGGGGERALVEVARNVELIKARDPNAAKSLRTDLTGIATNQKLRLILTRVFKP